MGARLLTTVHTGLSMAAAKERDVKAIVIGVLATVLTAAAASAQSPQQDVKKANDALLAAAAARDRAAYARLAGDDLRWVEADGQVRTKAERLAQLQGPPTASQRVFRDTDVKVYGDIAVVLLRSDWTSNGERLAERVQRVFVKRGGQWQMVSHSATPMGAAK